MAHRIMLQSTFEKKRYETVEAFKLDPVERKEARS
jgi:hypothetical protein